MTKAVAPILPGDLGAWSMVEDFSDIKRLLEGVEPAPQIQADQFRAAPQAGKTRASQRQAIPAVHTAFGMLSSGARLAASAVRAAGDALGQTADPGLDVLKAQEFKFSADPAAGPAPDAVLPARKYAGSLKEFQGAQLYTLSRYQTDAPALGIVFAQRPDGSRVYFVKEFGDDKPLSQAELDRWFQQRIQASLADTGQARKVAEEADFGNQAFQAEIAHNVLGQKQGQTSLDDLIKAAGGLASLGAAAQMDAATRDAGKQTQIVQGKLAQEAAVQAVQPAPTGPAEGVPPPTNEKQAPQPPPAAPGEQNGVAPAPGPRRDAQKMPLLLGGQDQLRDLLRLAEEEEDARQRELDAARERDEARSQQAGAERGAQRLADTLRQYQQQIQKKLQAEKSEEMLQLLRISHASRRYEGRFSSLAEKTFLTLINSSLVRRPGDDDDRRA